MQNMNKYDINYSLMLHYSIAINRITQVKNKKMNTKKINKENPFEVESLRAYFAQKRKHKELVETYTKAYSEIQDLNTPSFWDSFNTEGKRGKNPMDNDRIKTVTKLIKGKKILNVGFGSASLEKNYFEKNPTDSFLWKAIDISPASVKKAKKELLQGIFEVGSILDLKYKNNSFDYVVSLEVLEHIEPRNTFRALKEIFRVVKPKGYFIISIPLNEGLEQMIAQGYNPNAHVRIYTPELIKLELEITGFKVVKEKKLFAFHNLYKIKSFIASHISSRFKPNNIIILAQKPY